MCLPSEPPAELSPLQTYMYACTKMLANNTAPGQSHMPCRGCQGADFCREGGPRAGQRARQAHGGLWPFVFLMALSQFIIDFNSAMCHARGKWGFYDPTTARAAGCGRSPKTLAQMTGGREVFHHRQAALWWLGLGTASNRLKSYFAIEKLLHLSWNKSVFHLLCGLLP